MARFPMRLLYNFALVLTLCVSVGVAVVVLHHYSAPQAAEIPSDSGHGGLPLTW